MPPLTQHIGKPHPLGATPTPHGTNFAIYAREADTVSLLLRSPSSTQVTTIALRADRNRSGQVWHVELRPPQPGMSYAWRIGDDKHADPRFGNICLDPYAHHLDSPLGAAAFAAGKRDADVYRPWAVVPGSASFAHAAAFDWQDVPRPKIPWPELVLYEMHVRGFTNRDAGGTFLDLVKRIPYLKALGVNAVELLPIMEFNEREWCGPSGQSTDVCQYWGYSTVAFHVPMRRYATEDPVREFQTLVREMHRAGIEVFLDVVYNHTAEMGDDYVGPGFYGMKLLAPFTYYMRKSDGGFRNFSGCGNTINCNNPVVSDWIIDSLRYWAHDLGVDGFRFDLASILTRSSDSGNEGMEVPPLVMRIAKDPAFRDIKLIAEPWDCGGIYQVGGFPHFGTFAEWNGKFRDVVRRFVKGDPGCVGEFATRVCGSQDLYGDGRRPYHSVNFITAHDGFTMRDLVSYNEKHNMKNGENNNDGEAHNSSWNCGVEGETQDAGIKMLRERQMRNMYVALFVAAGTPMIVMGDEYGHTRFGNNNSWCQDNELSWFNWASAAGSGKMLLRFTSLLVKLRKTFSVFRREQFLSEADVTWHGRRVGRPEWGSSYNMLAMTLRGDGQEVYVAFNCGHEGRDVELPGGAQWARIIDTNLEAPKDFAEPGSERRLDGGSSYGMGPFSALLFMRLEKGRNWLAGDAGLEKAFEKLAVENGK